MNMNSGLIDAYDRRVKELELHNAMLAIERDKAQAERDALLRMLDRVTDMLESNYDLMGYAMCPQEAIEAREALNALGWKP